MSRKPKVGYIWRDHSCLGIGVRDTDNVLGVVAIRNDFGWYLGLSNTSASHNVHHALIYEGKYWALGFDTFFDFFDSMSRKRYETE
jgi:hypothetical protein